MSRYSKVENLKETYRVKKIRVRKDWPRKIRESIYLMKKHLFDRQLTVWWIKEQCRINNHNFSSRFAYYTGRSPKKYILYHRVEVAKKLLKDQKLSDLPVSIFALELGFSTVSAFSKCFKRETEMAPSHWRDGS